MQRMRILKLLTISVLIQILFALGLGILVSRLLTGHSAGWGDLIGFLMGLILGAWVGAALLLIIFANKSKIRKKIYVPIALLMLPLEMLTIFIFSSLSSITILLPVLLVSLNSLPVLLLSRKSNNLQTNIGS